MSIYEQVELPFEKGGFTQPLEALLEIFALKRKSRGPRRTAKPSLKGVDLNQSLLPDTVWGIEHAWPSVDESQKEKLTTNLSENVDRGRYRKLLSSGRNDEFSIPTVETIALLASKVLYAELQVLFSTSGNAARKRSILDWIFATNYTGGGSRKRKPGMTPMHKIPFTAQFCCVVEEIDYELLCEVCNDLVDSLRECQATAKDAQPIVKKETFDYGHQDYSRTLRSQFASHHPGPG